MFEKLEKILESINEKMDLERMIGFTYEKKDDKDCFIIFYSCGKVVSASMSKEGKIEATSTENNSENKPQYNINEVEIKYFAEDFRKKSMDEEFDHDESKFINFCKRISNRELAINQCEEDIRKIDEKLTVEERFKFKIIKSSDEEEVKKHILEICNDASKKNDNELMKIIRGLTNVERQLLNCYLKYDDIRNYRQEEFSDEELLINVKKKYNKYSENDFPIKNSDEQFKIKIDNIEKEKKQIYNKFLLCNYLIIDNIDNMTYEEAKALYNAEKDTKTFSSFAKNHIENCITNVVVEGKIVETEEEAKKPKIAAEVGPKFTIKDPNSIKLYSRRFDFEDGTNEKYIERKVLHKSLEKERAGDTLNHELVHFKLGKICVEHKDELQLAEVVDAEAAYVVSWIKQKIKDYVISESIDRYNKAANLLGLKNVEKVKVYNKYDVKNESTEMALLGHTEYAKYNPEEYIAEAVITNNFQKELLEELFENESIGDKSFICKKVLKANGGENIFEKFNDELKLKLQNGSIYDKLLKFSKEQNISFDFMKKALFFTENAESSIRKAIKYYIIFAALKETAETYNNSVKAGAINLKEKFNNTIDNKYKEIDWSLINIDVEKLKKEVRDDVEKYKKRIENVDEILFEKYIKEFYDRNVKMPFDEYKKATPSTINKIFNQSIEKVDDIKMPDTYEFHLMKKFMSVKPYYDNMLKRLDEVGNKAEGIKEILKEELKDAYEAYIFFDAIGKINDNYENPFVNFKAEKNDLLKLGSKNKQLLFDMIDGINITKEDIIKANKVLKGKSFYDIANEFIKKCNLEKEKSIPLDLKELKSNDKNDTKTTNFTQVRMNNIEAKYKKK